MVEKAGLVVDHQVQRLAVFGRVAVGMFDYNVAPFFQSFVEVKVEPSAGRVRVVPYGVNGRLTWDDLGRSDSLRREVSPNPSGSNGRFR